MDIAATLTYVAAIGGLASDSVSVQPGRYHLDEWKADEKRAAGIRLFLTDALLMSIMMRFVTVIYRYQCWRGTRLKRMEDRVSTSHSVRALLCWLGWACVAVIGCVQQAVVQIWAAYSFSMVSVVPSNALASLSRMPDEAARNSLVQGFIDSTDSATCLRVVHATCLTTGWQFPEAGPVGVPVEDSMVVTNGAHDVTLATSNCFMDDWNLFFKLIFTTAMLAGFAVINILGVSGVVAPLLGLLKHIIGESAASCPHHPLPTLPTLPTLPSPSPPLNASAPPPRCSCGIQPGRGGDARRGRLGQAGGGRPLGRGGGAEGRARHSPPVEGQPQGKGSG